MAEGRKDDHFMRGDLNFFFTMIRVKKLIGIEK